MTDIALPESSSGLALANDDLLWAVRPSQKDTATVNYGFRSQAFKDVLPEYWARHRELVVASGTFIYSAANHNLATVGTRLHSPTLAWASFQTTVVSLSTTTSWLASGFYSSPVDVPSGGRWRSWHHSRQVGSTNNELIEHESGLSHSGFRTVATTRIPTTAAGGWELQCRASDLALQLVEVGSAPHNQYTFTVQCAYVLV